MKRQDHNQYVLHDNYAECFIYDLNHKQIGSFLIDITDLEKCKKHRWCIVKKKGNYKSITTNTGSKKYVLARYLLDYDGELQIDHVNRNPMDNRRSNLRIVSVVENNANKVNKNMDLYPNGKYKCSFVRYNTRFYLGYFNTIEEAAKAKEQKLIEIENNKEYYINKYKEKAGQKITGVSPMPSGKWRADAFCNGKQIRIGTYDTKEEAANARTEYISKLIA